MKYISKLLNTKTKHTVISFAVVVVSFVAVFFLPALSQQDTSTVYGLSAECTPHDHSTYPNIAKSSGYNSYAKHMQQDLIKLGYAMPRYGADGYYGAESAAAVAKFKLDNGLSGDGTTFYQPDWAMLTTKINAYVAALPACAPPVVPPIVPPVVIPAPGLPTNPAVTTCRDNALFIVLGDTNQCVKTVQTFLKFILDGRRDYAVFCPNYVNTLGAPLKQTRIFDAQTESYIKCFQEKYGLVINGQITPSVYETMNQVCQIDNWYSGIPAGDNVTRYFKNYWFCDPNAKSIYLTFDDGPQLYRTTELLDLLQIKGVKVTFYVAGYRADIWYGPDILRDELARGHSIQNHTYHHKNLILYGSNYVRSEIDSTAKAIFNHTGVWPTCVRPPYGSTSTRVSNIIKNEFKSAVVIWTRNTGDYSSRSSSAILRSSKSWIAGDVVLGHDTLAVYWLPVLGTIIDNIRDRGLEFDSSCTNPTVKPY